MNKFSIHEINMEHLSVTIGKYVIIKVRATATFIITVHKDTIWLSLSHSKLFSLFTVIFNLKSSSLEHQLRILIDLLACAMEY